jgi:hypothetical protein
MLSSTNAGESPRRKHTTFRTWRKSEIKNISYVNQQYSKEVNTGYTFVGRSKTVETECTLIINFPKSIVSIVNPLMPELNPSAQRCLTKFFTADFAS